MATRVTKSQWAELDNLIGKGWTVKEAARRVGVGELAAYNRRRRQKKEERAEEIVHGTQMLTVRAGHELVEVPVGPAPKSYSDLCDQAKRALEDFSYFQRRYLGRIATPWQKMAAEDVVERLESPEKEYVVNNAPPGCGKSTTFTCDIPLWLTARNRGIRGQIGSASTTTARTYIDRLKRYMTLTVPYVPDDIDIKRGLAVPAEATLVEDFGMFDPGRTDRWSAEAIAVMQLVERPLVEKEPTWSAVGMDTRFLGMRYDIIIWDDLVDMQAIRTQEAREKQQEWWDNVAERRLDPAGVLILQGQRMGAEDLYRYCLDKEVLPDDDDEDDEAEHSPRNRQYHHVVFKAHYDENCKGAETHRRSSPYYPEGCLLDPRRLPWSDIRAAKANPRNNFQVIFQQEDVDPSNVLVDRLWITGGEDPVTHETYRGCTDPDRTLWELPPNLAGKVILVATADPSPTQYWSIQLWAVRISDGQPQERYLMDHVRRKLAAPDFLDWHNANQAFSGIMEDWQTRSESIRNPITAWIVEKNGAQQFLLQYEHVTRWKAAHRVRIIPHHTGANKADDEYGVQMLAGIYRHGLVRLPYRSGQAFGASRYLIDEVTVWPEGRTDDTVMAQWFLELNLPHLLPSAKPIPKAPRPSWLKGVNTWSWRGEKTNA